MTHQRKPFDVREKELRLAILRIGRRHSQTGAKRLTVSAVAREVGITPALIHNHYPDIAEEIRTKRGASSRQQRDAKQLDLKRERERSRELRKQLKESVLAVSRLTSINENLLEELRVLRISAMDPSVVSMSGRRPKMS